MVDIADKNRDANKTINVLEIGIQVAELLKESADDAWDGVVEGTPDNLVFGFSNGGSFLKSIKIPFAVIRGVAKGVLNAAIATKTVMAGDVENKNEDEVARIELNNIIPAEWNQERRGSCARS